MAANILHWKLVFVPYILQYDVESLSAIHGAFLGQETILIRILDAQGFVTVTHMLLEIVVKFDDPTFLGFVLDDGNGVFSLEV
jgi:hypothetical protein